MSVRYLGIQVASKAQNKTVCREVIRAVQVLMSLGSTNTTNELQRVELARVIVLSKLAFVSRRTPMDAATATILQRYVHHFIWNGWFDVAQQRRNRARVGITVRQLARMVGGFGEPDVRQALVAAGSRTVGRGAVDGWRLGAPYGYWSDPRVAQVVTVPPGTKVRVGDISDDMRNDPMGGLPLEQGNCSSPAAVHHHTRSDRV